MQYIASFRSHFDHAHRSYAALPMASETVSLDLTRASIVLPAGD